MCLLWSFEVHGPLQYNPPQPTLDLQLLHLLDRPISLLDLEEHINPQLHLDKCHLVHKLLVRVNCTLSYVRDLAIFCIDQHNRAGNIIQIVRLAGLDVLNLLSNEVLVRL
jgi:hypothetical protein